MNRIFQNTGIAVLQNVFNILVSVFVNGYIAAQLGTGDYGKFVFAFSFPLLFSVIADFGLQGYYTKRIAADRGQTRRHLGDMTALRLATSLAAIAIAATSVALMPLTPVALKATAVGIFAILVAQTFITNAWTAFMAHEDVKYVAVSNIISRVLVAALSIGVLRLGGGVLGVTGVYAVGYVVQVVYCQRILVKRGWTPVFAISLPALGGILRQALPFALFGVFSYLALQIDKTMIALISGEDALGIYNAASSICQNSNMLSLAVANAVFPSLVSSYKERRLQEFSDKVGLALKWLMLMGAPLAIIVGFYARDIVFFIYRNPKYEPTILVLQILIWMLPIDLVARMLRYALIAGDRENVVTWYYGIALVLNVVLNSLLMPKLAFIGAAIAAICTQAFLLAAQAVQYFRVFKVSLKVPYARIAFGNAALFAGLWLVSARLHWMLGTILALVSFTLLMWVTGVVGRSDLEAISSGKRRLR